MKNYAFCPVSPKVVNERVTRFNATLTILITVIFLFTSNIFLIGFLAFDFLLRGIDRPQFSPLAISSKGLVRSFDMRPQMINAGPKLFAARIGLVFSAAAFILFLSGFDLAAMVTASVLGLFSFLEGIFGYCVACKIYPFVYNWLNEPSLKRL